VALLFGVLTALGGVVVARRGVMVAGAGPREYSRVSSRRRADGRGTGMTG